MQLADLVEEDRAAVGRLELPDLELVGAGEGAALVAEQLALQEVTRHGGAVDLDERGRAPRREAWIARATMSFPVPVSPRSSTVMSTRAACWIVPQSSRIFGLCQRPISRRRRAVSESRPVGISSPARRLPEPLPGCCWKPSSS